MLDYLDKYLVPQAEDKDDQLFSYLDKYLPSAKPEPDPGYLGEAARAVEHGVKVTVPKAVGEALKFFGAEETGQGIVDSATARETRSNVESAAGKANPEWYSIRGNVYEALDNAVLSFGPGAAGAAIGAAATAFTGPGAAVGALVGYAIGSIAALPVFYGSQAQNSYEAVKKNLAEQGMDPAEAEQRALASAHGEGMVEAGFEGLTSFIPFAPLLKPFAKLGAKGAGTAVKEMFAPSLSGFGKTLAKIEGAEVGTEVVQQVAEEEIRQRVGLTGEGATLEGAASVVMPTAIMSLIPGLAGAGSRQAQLSATKKALESAETDPEVRAKILLSAASQIQEQDEGLARDLASYGMAQIAAGKPINLGQKDEQIAAAGQFVRDEYAAHREDQQGTLDNEAPAQIAPDSAPPMAALPPPGEVPLPMGQQMDPTELPVVTPGEEHAARVEGERMAEDVRLAQLGAPNAGQPLANAPALPAAAPAMLPPGAGATPTPPAAQRLATGRETASTVPIDPDDPRGTVDAILAAPLTPVGGARVPAGINRPLAEASAGDLAGIMLHIKQLELDSKLRPPKVRAAMMQQAAGLRQDAAALLQDFERKHGPEARASVHSAATATFHAMRGDYRGFQRPAVQESAVFTEREQASGVNQPEGEGDRGQPVLAKPEIVAPESDLDQAAHEAAASPQNERQEPTQPQAGAGNYKMGHVVFEANGMGVSIENPAGSVRSDKKNTPPRWSRRMEGVHYGYWKGTESSDSTETKKQGIDVMILNGTPTTWDGPVFVVNQVNKDGAFDEPKSIVGAKTEAEAKDAYLAQYDDGWTGLGSIHETTMQGFKEWATTPGAARSPFAEEQKEGTKAETQDGATSASVGSPSLVPRQAFPWAAGIKRKTLKTLLHEAALAVRQALFKSPDMVSTGLLSNIGSEHLKQTERETVAATLGAAIEMGVPESYMEGLTGFFSYDGDLFESDGVHAFIFSTRKSAIGFNRYLLRHAAIRPAEAANLTVTTIHELHHEIDRTGKGHSSVLSPRFEIDGQNASSALYFPKGDIVREAIGFYAREKSSALGQHLNYPLMALMYPSADLTHVKQELFAQLGAAWYIMRDEMKRHLPIAYKAFTEIHDASIQAAAEGRGVRGAREAVQRVLRAQSPVPAGNQPGRPVSPHEASVGKQDAGRGLGEAREDAGPARTKQGRSPVTVEGVHYGALPGLASLSGSKYGTGASRAAGEESRRLQGASSKIRSRVYFYERSGNKLPVSEGAVTASHVYSATIPNVLDVKSEDAQRIMRETPRNALNELDLNKFEEAVVDAGYDGYKNGGSIVVLDRDVEAKYLGNRLQASKAAEAFPADSVEMFNEAVIDKAKTTQYKSREKLISMSIDDFLSMAEKLDREWKEKSDRLESLLHSKGKFSDIPFLLFDSNGSQAKVTGHEGRHRATLLRKLGYTHLPVLLRGDIRWSEQSSRERFDYVKQWPETLVGQSGDNIPFPVSRDSAPENYDAPVGSEGSILAHKPLEPIDIPVVYHGSRDPKGVLELGISAKPAIDLSNLPEFAWRGARDSGFTDGGGVNWYAPTWRWWMSLPKQSRAAFQQEVGVPIRSADDLGEHVSLIFTSETKHEAERYSKSGPPFAIDPSKINGILGYYQPDINDKRETVLVVRAGSNIGIKNALVAEGSILAHKTQTETPKFKKWFGYSKVVDKNGKPLVVYHGTTRDFTRFAKGDIPYRGGLLAFFTASKPFANDYATTGEGANVMPVYLSIQNPFDFRKDAWMVDTFYEETGGVSDAADARRMLMGLGRAEDIFDESVSAANLTQEDFKNLVESGSWDALESSEFVEWLREGGHDGIVLLENKALNYAVFEPTQIKSATGNRGTFDPSEGSILAHKTQTETPEFKKWFGDSKVVDKNGEPLVVYHATVSDFEWFDRDLSEADNYAGFFFTDSKDAANTFAEGRPKANIMPVYLSAKKVATVTNEQWLNGKGMSPQQAEERGYDAMRIVGQEGGNTYIVFKEENIKSATGNRGTFDPSEGSILAHKTKPHGKSASLEVRRSGVPIKLKGLEAIFEYLNKLVADDFGGPLNYDDKKAVARATEHAKQEIRHQITEARSGLDWYSHDIKKAFEITAKVIPELKDERQRQIFTIAAALHSPNTEASDNWQDAARNFQEFLKTGEFSPINPETQARWRPRVQPISIVQLNSMIRDMGIDRAADWLLTVHSVSELRDMKQKYGVYKVTLGKDGKRRPSEEIGVPGDPSEERLGAHIFGEKVGPFALGLNGFDTEVAVDKWATRTLRRWFGSHGIYTKTSTNAEAPTSEERALFKQIVSEVGRELQYAPAQMQAVLWFFEQQLYTSMGLKSSSSFFSDGAQAFVDGVTYDTERAGGDRASGGVPAEAEEGGRLLAHKAEVGEATYDDFLKDPKAALKKPGWAVVTATTQGDPNSPANLAANKALEAILIERGIEYEEVKGSWKGDDQGRNFLIFGPESLARRLGQQFDQESVLTNSGWVYSDGRPNATALHDQTVFGEEAKKQDNFTTLPDGQTFSMKFDWPEQPAAAVELAKYEPTEVSAVGLDEETGEEVDIMVDGELALKTLDEDIEKVRSVLKCLSF